MGFVGRTFFLIISIAFLVSFKGLAFQPTIEGQIIDADGVIPYNADFKLEVYDESETCLLYSEEHNGVALADNLGVFALKLGSGSNQVNNSDSSTSFSQNIFYNNIPAPASCSGTVFTNSTKRKIKIIYDSGASVTEITPMLEIGGSPYASTLNGYSEDYFINNFAGSALPGSAPDTNEVLQWDGLKWVYRATRFKSSSNVLNDGSEFIWELPDSDGLNGQVLKTDGAGVLSWTTPSGAGDFLANGTTPMTGDLDMGDGTHQIIDLADPTNDQDAATKKYVDDKLAVATGATAGIMSAADKAKLDAIENNATADQTPAEIKAAMLGEDGTGSGLDSDLLDGEEGSHYLAWGNLTGVPGDIVDGDADTAKSLDVAYGVGSTVTVDSSDVIFNLSSTQDFHVQDGGAAAFSVTDDGRVGVGTASPSAKLEVTGSADTVQLIAQANGTQTANILEVKDSGGSVVAQVSADGSISAGQDLITKGWIDSQGFGTGSGDITEVTTAANTSGLSGGALSSAVALSVDIDGTTAETTIDGTADKVLIWDSDAGALKSMTRNDFVAGVDTDNDTIYTADGNGIELSGTEFQLELDGSTLAVGASGLSVNAIGSSEITDGEIANADISTSAAIARSKMAAGSANRILVNDGTGAVTDAAAITANRALVSDSNGIPVALAAVDNTELGYLDGVTSGIQTQLDGKISDIVADTTPQLGGNLDVNGNNLTSTTGLDIAIGGLAGNDFTVDTDKLVVEGDTGNVGIGTSAPTSDLHISRDDPRLRLVDPTDTARFVDLRTSGDGANSHLEATQSDLIIGAKNTGHEIFFRTDNTNRVTISGGGNVGVGTTSPQSLLQVNGGVQIGSDGAGCDGAKAGTLRYNAGLVEYCNGTSWGSFKSGASITSLNGSTQSTQTFAAVGTTGAAPNWSTNTGTGAHTLHIPMAGTVGVTAGLISKTDYDAFDGKLSPALNNGQIFVGSGSNVATGVAMSGDATIANTGALTLSMSGVTAGTYKSVTVDAKGRVTAATNPTTLGGYGITDAVEVGGDTMTGTLNLPSNGLVVGTDQLTVSGGNVGIGTASPGAKLSIYTGASGSGGAHTHANEFVIEGSANTGMSILTPNNRTANINFGDDVGANVGAILYNHTDDSMKLKVADSDRLTIISNGSVGVGTATPSSLLHVNGTAEIEGNLDMNNNKITGLDTPTNPDEAATKDYVDNHGPHLNAFWFTKADSSLSSSATMDNVGFTSPTVSRNVTFHDEGGPNDNDDYFLPTVAGYYRIRSQISTGMTGAASNQVAIYFQDGGNTPVEIIQAENYESKTVGVSAIVYVDGVDDKIFIRFERGGSAGSDNFDAAMSYVEGTLIAPGAP